MNNELTDAQVLGVCKDTLISLIKKRKDETNYKIYTDALPASKYISDPILKWLMEQYDIIEENTKDIK